MAKLLITDDSATARMIIQRCIEVLGWDKCEFLHAADGVAALEIVMKQQVDLIITDIVMPVMDGRALLKRIKVSPKLNHIPVFVISSLANPAMEQEMMQFGVDRLIYKPVSPPKLLEALEATLGKDFREK
ncbi:MAG: response regulator [Candidatus Rifleibacteriota bacterium]